MKLIKQLKTIVLALAVVALAGSADAQGYLLTIDLAGYTNNGNYYATITATGNLPSVNIDPSMQWDSVILSGFANQNVYNFGRYLSGDLAFAGSTSSFGYFTFESTSYPANGPDMFLNGSDGSLFNTSTPAFTGTAVMGFLYYEKTLPVLGQTGDIRVGLIRGTYGPVIGQWIIVGPNAVPEPGTLALAGLGGASVLLSLRRRKHS